MIEKVKQALKRCSENGSCGTCYKAKGEYQDDPARIKCKKELMQEALALLKEQEKENRALRKLLDWAVECDWGLDNLGDWWVDRFANEIKGLGYTESLIHLARRYIEVFEEGEDDAE